MPTVFEAKKRQHTWPAKPRKARRHNCRNTRIKKTHPNTRLRMIKTGNKMAALEPLLGDNKQLNAP